MAEFKWNLFNEIQPDLSTTFRILVMNIKDPDSLTYALAQLSDGTWTDSDNEYHWNNDGSYILPPNEKTDKFSRLMNMTHWSEIPLPK